MDGVPQFCDDCPIKDLRDYNPSKFLAVVQGMESQGPFLNERSTSGFDRRVLRILLQEDGEFKDGRVAELAVVALERHLDGKCIESKGE